MAKHYPDPAAHTGFTPYLSEGQEQYIDPALLQQSLLDSAPLDDEFWASFVFENGPADATVEDPPAGESVHGPERASATTDPDLVSPSNIGAILQDRDLDRRQNLTSTRATNTAAAGINQAAVGTNPNMCGPGDQEPDHVEEEGEFQYYPQAPYFDMPLQHPEPPPLQYENPTAGPSRYGQQQDFHYAAEGVDPSLLARNPTNLYNQYPGQAPPIFGPVDWQGNQAQIVDQHQAEMRRRRQPIPEISPKTIPAEQTPTTPSLKRRFYDTEDSTPQPDSSRTKRDCPDCNKTFFASKDPRLARCSRCFAKYVKNHAAPTIYDYDQNITIDSAWSTLYPTLPAATIPRDDVQQERQHGDHYMRQLVEAVTTPYTGDGSTTKDNLQRIAQQTKMNKKPYDSAQYTSDLVNKRLHLLYQTAVSYHAGGQTYYDVGGDNSGYGEDKTLIFSERLNKIINLLTTNKDIAMDVIEGRGVTALVMNPAKYERRKRDNKKSNDTKQGLQDKGKQAIEEEERKSKAGMSVPPQESVEGWDDGGEGFAGPSQQPGGEYEGYTAAWR